MAVGQVGIADVDVVEVWKRLEADPAARLIDVRTKAEWSFVGLPDLAAIGKRIILVEWQTFPDGKPVPGFATSLDAELSRDGAAKSDSLYFICRSGGRSLLAARAMAAAGYASCHNVADGFEGPLDAERHRGGVAGWKARGLPWTQG
jgi:rhodanese-related sulfurtransferase